ADHLDLPSFPTRRSSDLFLVGGGFLLGGWRCFGARVAAVRAFQGRGMAELAKGLPGVPSRPIEVLESVLRTSEGVKMGLHHGLQDRKSTRLNSSHVKISY